MNILAIDTSTDIELICVSVKGRVYQYCGNAGMSHSVTMFGNLSQLLSEASISMGDIDLIGTGIGPGSFTGIRIAVTTARMFAQILKVPLVGIKSPELYAASVTPEGVKTVLVAFDARKSRVFAGIYRCCGPDTHEIVEPGDYDMTQLLQSMENPGDVTCIGDGCKKYLDKINEFCRFKGIGFEYMEEFLPDGGAAAELILTKYNKDPDKYRYFNDTVPFYSRKSDAEILNKR